MRTMFYYRVIDRRVVRVVLLFYAKTVSTLTIRIFFQLLIPLLVSEYVCWQQWLG